MASGPTWRTADEPPPPRFVRDRSGSIHELGRLVGRGGQGRVYRVEHSHLSVKLCHQVSSGLCRSLEERLARLRWLPLEDLPVSRPLELLADPDAGYTMELLEGVAAMTGLCEPPEALDKWYADGGGLRRRLRLLARCAEILAKLHGRGIVYGDVSPGNVLVSESREHQQVWLVDADNLQVESSWAGPPVYTPYYRAPELIRGQAVNTQFTDAYSFAVLAYQTLVADHPLFGDLVENGPVELQQDAERGLIPWAGHRTDDRNRSSTGIQPPARAITHRLSELFSRTFEDGMTDPRSRPSLGEWSAALHSAADVTVVCTCGHSYYAWEPSCPWCDAGRPDVLLVMVGEQLPSGFGDDSRQPVLLEPTVHLVLQADLPAVVTARTTQLAPDWLDAPIARLGWNGESTVWIRNLGDRSLRRASDQGKSLLLPAQAEARERLPDAWRLHFDDDERIHRVLILARPRSGGGSDAR